MTLKVHYESEGKEQTLDITNAGEPGFHPSGFIMFRESDGRVVSMMPFHRVVRVEFEDNRIAQVKGIIVPPGQQVQ